jgi:hypothetical protein
LTIAKRRRRRARAPRNGAAAATTGAEHDPSIRGAPRRRVERESCCERRR